MESPIGRPANPLAGMRPPSVCAKAVMVKRAKMAVTKVCRSIGSVFIRYLVLPGDPRTGSFSYRTKVGGVRL